MSKANLGTVELLGGEMPLGCFHKAAELQLTSVMKAIMAATAQVVYGEVLWNPLTIILLWNNRAAKFFAGFLFAFATIATSKNMFFSYRRGFSLLLTH